MAARADKASAPGQVRVNPVAAVTTHTRIVDRQDKVGPQGTISPSGPLPDGAVVTSGDQPGPRCSSEVKKAHYLCPPGQPAHPARLAVAALRARRRAMRHPGRIGTHPPRILPLPRGHRLHRRGAALLIERYVTQNKGRGTPGPRPSSTSQPRPDHARPCSPSPASGQHAHGPSVGQSLIRTGKPPSWSPSRPRHSLFRIHGSTYTAETALPSPRRALQIWTSQPSRLAKHRYDLANPCPSSAARGGRCGWPHRR